MTSTERVGLLSQRLSFFSLIYFLLGVHEERVHVFCRMMAPAGSVFLLFGIILEITCVAGKNIN